MGLYVAITYFKTSGKYYSEGSYVSQETAFHRVVDEVYGMFREGTCPGLQNNGLQRNHFDAVIYVGTDENDKDGLPHLVRAYQVCECARCREIKYTLAATGDLPGVRDE